MPAHSDSSYSDTSDSEYEEGKSITVAANKIKKSTAKTISRNSLKNANTGNVTSTTSITSVTNTNSMNNTDNTNLTLNGVPTSTEIKRIICAAELKEFSKKVTVATRKKTAKATVAVVEPKRKVYKKSVKTSWPDIFAQSKAIVSTPVNYSSHSSSHGMTINFCDSDFLATFGYSDCNSGISFTSLVGRATSLATLGKIETALREARTCGEYINLYRSDGTTPLSCHVCVLPFKNYIGGESSTSRNQHNEGLGGGGGGVNIIQWGSITVRSASAVGNARFSGLSFLGLDRVSEEVRENYYNTKILGLTSGSSVANCGVSGGVNGTGNGDLNNLEMDGKSTVSSGTAAVVPTANRRTAKKTIIREASV